MYQATASAVVLLHIVWHTKMSRYLIKVDMEQTVYDYIRWRAESRAGTRRLKPGPGKPVKTGSASVAGFAAAEALA